MKRIWGVDSDIAVAVARCMGIHSLEDIFERDRPFSKHIVCLRYFLQGGIKHADSDLNEYGLRVRGPFVVYT